MERIVHKFDFYNFGLQMMCGLFTTWLGERAIPYEQTWRGVTCKRCLKRRDKR